MSKLNALGLELLDLKTAIATEYPEIVKKSLTQTVDDMLKNEIIDQETHYLLTEPVFAFKDFKKFCLEKQAYCKSEEELLSLYEEKRVRLEEALQRCIEQQQISVVNYLKEEQIMVVKTYRFGMEQVKKYFGIESAEDCLALMGRKRFIERFVALRYPKIMKEFVLKYSKPKGHFRLAHSSVYYDEETQSYAIELLFKIDIGTFEEVEISTFERPIIKMIERCNQWFTDHLGVDGDFYAPISTTQERQQTKTQPKSQIREIQESKPILNGEKTLIKPQVKESTIEKESPIVSSIQKTTTPVSETKEEKLFKIESIEDFQPDDISLEDPIIDADFKIPADIENISFDIGDIPVDFDPNELL